MTSVAQCIADKPRQILVAAFAFLALGLYANAVGSINQIPPLVSNMLGMVVLTIPQVFCARIYALEKAEFDAFLGKIRGLKNPIIAVLVLAVAAALSRGPNSMAHQGIVAAGLASYITIVHALWLSSRKD